MLSPLQNLSPPPHPPHSPVSGFVRYGGALFRRVDRQRADRLDHSLHPTHGNVRLHRRFGQRHISTEVGSDERRRSVAALATQSSCGWRRWHRSRLPQHRLRRDDWFLPCGAARARTFVRKFVTGNVVISRNGSCRAF